MKSLALIVAAGRGQRAGGGVPKQYQQLGDYPVLEWSITAFLGSVEKIALIVHPDDKIYYAPLTDKYKAFLLPVIFGGDTRQDSVARGLAALAEESPDIVLIHDAARPFATNILVQRMIDALQAGDAAIPALPITDSLKRVDASRQVVSNISRDELWRAQTPQAFRFDLIYAAHRQFMGQAMTDDASLIEAMGKTVTVILGEERNFKITTEADFDMAKRMLEAEMETRIGQGFDVHAFSQDINRPLWLGGLKLAEKGGLEGHSDADVALHALTDALLGALGLGDIGQHFPPSDSQWKNVPSERFLSHAFALLLSEGGRIINADLTIICESPKIGPYRDEMRNRIADILGIEAQRVNVKATTTEKLGFTGRSEGIAAQAVVSIKLPADIK